MTSFITSARREKLSRRLALTVLAIAALCVPAPTAWAWGPMVHRLVTTKAVDTLPKGLKGFYKKHRLEIPSLALEAEFAEEGLERRFAVDRLAAFPFLDLPQSEKAFLARYGEEAGAVGRLPWLIHESFDRLVEAFRAGDKARILEESDTLAGLLTDLHNPLALTDNADGQNTEQHGLWVRFSVKLPEAMEKDLKLKTDAAHIRERPKEHVFAMVSSNYVWLDNLLYRESLAHRTAQAYSEIYYQAFAQRASDLLKRRLGLAASECGSYWYTAWVFAGKPELEP